MKIILAKNLYFLSRHDLGWDYRTAQIIYKTKNLLTPLTRGYNRIILPLERQSLTIANGFTHVIVVKQTTRIFWTGKLIINGKFVILVNGALVDKNGHYQNTFNQ